MTDTTHKLEDAAHVEKFWDKFVEINPPPSDMPDDAKQIYKWFFTCGMASMVAMCQRLETETPERRAAILKQLYDELAEIPDSQRLNG